MENEKNEFPSLLRAFHPLFYPRLFSLVVNKKKERGSKEPRSIISILKDDYDGLTRRLDRAEVQESCTVRNNLRTRKLALALINSKGELQKNLIDETVAYLKNNLYSLGPNRQYDAKREEHILRVLTFLQNDSSFSKIIRQINRPSNRWAEEMIKASLDLPDNTVVNDVHAKQAVLSAWLCYLRQNVGSCFATAPAEIIHDEQPLHFLQDMQDMLATGRLKRTFGGIEHAVPLSASWGNGDLKKPLKIRTTPKGIFPQIWFSQGLIEAFDRAGCFNPGMGLKEKTRQLEKWIIPLVKRPYSQPDCIITAEEIIRIILLKFLGLNEQQLKEYENRPQASFMQTQLVIQSPLTSKPAGGIGKRCEEFYHVFEKSKNAFKSLTENALLKCWEYTLASFSETKYAFAEWNLYESLGLGTEEPGGIGECIYHIIQKKLDIINQQNKDLEYEYEALYTQVKTLESRIRHASTEKEIEWLKIDYRSRVGELDFIQEQRQEKGYQAKALVDLYETFYRLYSELFKEYFQEVYDAELQDVKTGPFDDSPAGFRLLYKHGRSNTSQWTLIHNPHEFIEALASFFVATEPQILHSLETYRMEKVLSEIVSAIIVHIKTNEFLESAFKRMAKAHKAPIVQNPLENLDLIEKKPWVFTSGGVMSTLISCYYRLEGKPTVIEKWVENETELLVFLADTMKSFSPKLLEPYKKGLRNGFLMHSPTHAFILKPFLPVFKNTWDNDQFTFTYIRDQFILPAESFVEQILLGEEVIRLVAEELCKKIPVNFQPRFRAIFDGLKGPANPVFFREFILEKISRDRGLRLGSYLILTSDEIDHFLYKHLPFFPSSELKDRLYKLLHLLPGIDLMQREQFFNLFDHFTLEDKGPTYLGAYQLQSICKALISAVLVTTTSQYDYHYLVSLAAQQIGFAMPAPIIFADTNWIKDEFGFVVNPGTKRLELWRLDYTGSEGYPMSSWKMWMNGTHPDKKWGIYTKPNEYGQ